MNLSFGKRVLARSSTNIQPNELLDIYAILFVIYLNKQQQGLNKFLYSRMYKLFLEAIIQIFKNLSRKILRLKLIYINWRQSSESSAGGENILRI